MVLEIALLIFCALACVVLSISNFLIFIRNKKFENLLLGFLFILPLTLFIYNLIIYTHEY